MTRRTVCLLIAAGLVGLVLLYKYVNPLQYAFFPQCPIKQITGYDCPGCGSQRATHHLLNGDVRQAFEHNQLLFVFTPYIALGLYFQLMPQLTHKELEVRKILYGYRAIQVVGIIITLFTIWRNFY